MQQAVAIVGMACQYADARSPSELWENVLAGRRAFRRIPRERLDLDDYYSADRRSPDRTYSTEGAFIEGFEFDRARFRVPGSTYRAADQTHWLALAVADAALADAGFRDGEALPRESTGVFIGNTLTGEFSRANVLRLRWPYVRRVLGRILDEDSCPAERRRELLARAERLYKQPFPPVGEETLAGGLANTIAGRVCNHFDLKGGGYTLDGACASSLLAVINACASLAAGDIDVALAGGVDLSIDPFELIGFAKTGALAEDLMRVYDARPAGFWPGEGCGLLVLMRHEEAQARRLRIHAVIRGWGISSDGGGGITRPEVEGQLLALRRAYARAGYGIETVTYFEGHGTGTAVGDATELRALTRARREAAAAKGGAAITPAALGSVKANIGHTKAAAGVAGLIKAAMAVRTRVLPPTTGCDEPNELLCEDEPALRVLRRGELFPVGAAPRAGVSAMGFGGINTHITIEAASEERRESLNSRERALLSSAQDAELFLFAARDPGELAAGIERVLAYAARLSRAELADLAAALTSRLGRGRARAGVIAATPAELSTRLEALRTLVRAQSKPCIDATAGLFFNDGPGAARIGFLFPGQGSPAHADGGAWRHRFEFVDELYARAALEIKGDSVRTEVAQPAIATASLAALGVMARLGITARVGVGHSLGELCALAWAGSIDEGALLRTARERGRAMASVVGPKGAMLSVGAGLSTVEQILNGDEVVVAGINSPTQTVLSGEARAVAAVARRCEARNLRCLPLSVSHAFHSPLVAAAAPHLAEHLAGEELRPPRRTVVSTVTGQRLSPDADLRSLLCRQVTQAVRFMEAVRVAAEEGVDLWLEVGPGRTLTGLVAELSETPAVALDACGPSLRGLLSGVAACFVSGAEVEPSELFNGRFTRPFDLDYRPLFFTNPCELAPSDIEPAVACAAEDCEQSEVEGQSADAWAGASEETAVPEAAAPLELVRHLVAERTELPVSTLRDDSRMLDDLHLNSITVAQLVAEASRRLNLAPPPAPTHYANSTLAEIAQTLAAARDAKPAAARDEGPLPQGVAEWVRPFVVELVERRLEERELPAAAGGWRVVAPADYPLGDALRAAFAKLEAGQGIVVALPPAPAERHVELLLEGARAAHKGGDGFRFVLVQHGGGAAAFARTLHLERTGVTTCVVDMPLNLDGAPSLIVAEALTAQGHVEAHYDALGVRRVPVLRPLPLDGNGASALPLTTADVLVVTGGARGITAECALMLARESGARLALLGLTGPEEDEEIAANLERMKAAGVVFRFYRVDVGDERAVREAVRKVESELGPVTGLLHGAARNVPCLIEKLDAETFAATLRPKVKGAENLLAAVDPARLRCLISFGSIIARSGLPGEADYGLANEWLTRLTEEWQQRHPHCRCLSIEWSIWSGVGMGARLGTLDALERRGINPISPEQGVAMLRRLLTAGGGRISAVVMGRFQDLPTLEIERPEIPFLRFLERPRVYYPQIELVVDAELSAESDPYLDDHAFRGARLLPAVMGLEAMAQAVMALTGAEEPPLFEEVSFERPVTLGAGVTNAIRVAALVRESGLIEVVLRSSETNFQADHFRALCRPAALVEEGELSISTPTANANNGAHLSAPLPLEPGRDLYGKLLFHRGRFRRLRAYRRLCATECLAEIEPDGTTSWFGRYTPAGLVLGDPGARDAAIHAVQACIPQATLLPIGVGRVRLARRAAADAVFVRASERERRGDSFIYDLELFTADGGICERWERLCLRAVAGADYAGPWPEPLLAPYVERRVAELLGGASVSVAFERDAAAERSERSARALARALGAGASVQRRADGKPEASDGRHVSASHAGDLSMAVAAAVPAGCDVEPVKARPFEVWRGLLGAERLALAELIAREIGDSLDVAATRVWTAGECLKKAGAAAPLVLTSAERDGWVALSAGGLGVASCVVTVGDGTERLAISVLGGSEDAGV
jgi:enediyne polyketide synthase